MVPEPSHKTPHATPVVLFMVCWEIMPRKNTGLLRAVMVVMNQDGYSQVKLNSYIL
jgi:hypothetical protein